MCFMLYEQTSHPPLTVQHLLGRSSCLEEKTSSGSDLHVRMSRTGDQSERGRFMDQW